MKSNKVNWIAIVAMLSVSYAWAQEPMAEKMESMPGMDHGQQKDSPGDADQADKPKALPKSGHDMNNMNQDSAMGSMSMQSGSPAPDARDPRAYSDGYDFGPISPPRMMGEEHPFHSLLFDRLERRRTRDNSSTIYDLQAVFGRTYDRAVLKAEGDIDNGKLQEGRTELLWGHALTTFWDTQLGARYDNGVGTNRHWLAAGVQGLAPYWFEIEATGYIGEQGRSAFRLATEYELLLTQRLILQPRLEANFYGKRDSERELGSGLSDVAAGLRLRYEIRREFAPYIGVERSGKFGGTADFARAEGKQTMETRVVVGLRFWF